MLYECVGEIRRGLFFANLPVARLSLFVDSLAIEPAAAGFRPLVVPWHAKLTDLDLVESVASNALRAGVRLLTKSGEYRIFYCSKTQRSAILNLLAAQGVPVELTPQKVGWLFPKF